MKGKAQHPLTIVRVEDEKPGHFAGVYAKVIVRDGTGKEFFFRKGCFVFDLEPLIPFDTGDVKP